jgi:hypothetical protein
MTKRGGDDITRVFAARGDYPVRFPDTVYDEDKQLLRAIVQYCAEELAAKTCIVEGVDKRAMFTGFEYTIVHHRTETRNFYALTFHLAYNVLVDWRSIKPLEAGPTGGAIVILTHSPRPGHEYLLVGQCDVENELVALPRGGAHHDQVQARDELHRATACFCVQPGLRAIADAACTTANGCLSRRGGGRRQLARLVTAPLQTRTDRCTRYRVDEG